MHASLLNLTLNAHQNKFHLHDDDDNDDLNKVSGMNFHLNKYPHNFIYKKKNIQISKNDSPFLYYRRVPIADLK